MQKVPGRTHADLQVTSQPLRGSTVPLATHADGQQRSRHEDDIRGGTTPWITLSLSRNKFFEAAALSPLAAACDAMDAAMLTRKSNERSSHVLSAWLPTTRRHRSSGGDGRCLARMRVTHARSVNSASSSHTRTSKRVQCLHCRGVTVPAACHIIIIMWHMML